MGIRTDRLKQAMTDADIDQAKLAEAVGCTQGAISQILLGNTQRSRYMPDIAQELGVSLQWLKGESDQRDPGGPAVPTIEDVARHFNLTLVPEVELGYSMGGGSSGGEYYSTNYDVQSYVPFPTDWLKTIAKGAAGELFVARGDGDSMMSTILDGDLILIDTSQKMLKAQDKIWAVSYGGLGMVKRLRRQPDGKIIINSDNPAVSPYPPATDDEVHIIGRVCWIGRKI